MSIFKCKMCGGTLEINTETVATCEHCGTQQTLPKISDDKKANMYDRANHFRRNNEFDKAMGIYEQILNEDNTDAETYWSLVLCRYGIEYVEDPVTRKRVPTVNRAQFTSVYDDDNYKSALQYADMYQKAVYEQEAKAINEIQKGILAISQKEEPFDVFICYKETDNNGRRTPDSVLANDLYHQLTQEGFKVFFSRITLEDKLGSAYEPYIFAALNSAKVMVVLGTRPEYFSAVWVKNEWSRYLALIKQGQKKMLIPAYKDMDPYDLPEEFSHLQAQDMSKLGFMQDLIRGIKKIVQVEEEKNIVVKETAVTENNTNIVPLLKRVFLFLEDEDWASADEYCEKVLDIDPECAEAYLGKIMVKVHVKRKEDLKKCKYLFDGSDFHFRENKGLYEKTIRYANENLKAEVQGYIDFINNRNSDEIYSNAVDKMNSATHSKDYMDASELFEKILSFKDSEILKAECHRKFEELSKEEEYSQACRMMKVADTIDEYLQACDRFENLTGYQDADAKFTRCIEIIKDQIEGLIKKLTNTSGCIELINKINTIEVLDNKEEYVIRIQELKEKFVGLERENKEFAKKRELERLDERIREREDYLESLYYGHRCPGVIVGMVAGIIISIPLIISKDEIAVALGWPLLIAFVIGLIVTISVGRPSTRPAIPRTRKEIEDLYAQRAALERGDMSVINRMRQANDNVLAFGGWVCEVCKRGNGANIWCCSCGRTKENNDKEIRMKKLLEQGLITYRDYEDEVRNLK